MRVQIEAYAHEIHDHHADAVDRINGWLEPVEQWNKAVVH
jgi:hypothetical protein